ncbi:ankyrin repeat domain-containing protein [Hydrogenophaga pseudoflava]|uniref:ankyrin repeat domain-containing protein n=1 Tax=Hydrogenophaga pseudoflava TaxID=47421 RepID=UPI0027E422E5|nr:ankyrin repeat domain-containing protein [Hydrogenophaga pseudoflava]MDQ7742885.1 ankyrin repeat domain-containing protein [Hydrogenophaga pseudoflava]
MNRRDHLPPTPDDALLQRYREANELDTARPGAALRENVLAHARAAAASRTDAIRPEVRPAANDSVWTWRALGGLAVIGLVGLLVLQFDHGNLEEKELALGSGISRPAAETAASSPPPEPAPAAEPAPRKASPQRSEAPAPAPASDPQAPDRMAKAEAPEGPEAPAPAAKSLTPQAPAPMPRAAPASRAAAPATADSAASAEGGVMRERREVTTIRPEPLSPMFAAIASGDAKAVDQRLAEGADPNERDPAGRTPLIAAARTGNEAVVKRLLAAGADRTLRDRDGLSAADHAGRNGSPGLLPLLR